MTGRIRNPFLLQRLARVPGEALQLIGHGVDAIVLFATRQPTKDQRLGRYQRALSVRSTKDHAARVYRGELLQRAWRAAVGGAGQVVPIESLRAARRRTTQRNRPA